MNNVEILAPAGSLEALKAAVKSGADAVYLGAGSFNARRNATNFSLEDLKEAVTYCHVRGVKVHLTLNTLVSDTELEDALELIKCACAFGVDAFIIQDLGLARLVRDVAPNMELHASTQCAVMNAEGFRQLEALGFSRVVLPRELSLQEIREIRKQTSLELELFVHGALCMCVSGQCYLSAVLGERSGNRGLCAQPCRLPFAAEGGTGHDLSLKDLSIVDYIPELAEAGITSFKIEGRMKRPEYVAAAVTACRNAVEGRYDPKLQNELRAVFSRSGHTEDYLKGNRGKHMFGTRVKDDVTAAAPVLKHLAELYQEDQFLTPVTMEFFAAEGKQAKLIVKLNDFTGRAVSADSVQAAQNKAATVESVEKQLRKTGGTGFTVESIETNLEGTLFLPVSVLNELRREALDNLQQELLNSTVRSYQTPDLLPEQLPVHRVKSIPPEKVVRIARESQLVPALFTAQAHTGRIVVPLFSSDRTFAQLREKEVTFGVELPRALYGDQNKLERQLEYAKEQGASFAFVGNLDGVQFAKKQGLPVLGNFTLNAYNSLTLSEYQRMGLRGVVTSAELTLKDAAQLRGSLERGIIAYGRIPLMLTRNCPVRNGRNCKDCKQDGSLTDRKGIQFPVVCNNGASELLNSRPIYLADRLNELHGMDFLVLYFTIEEPEEVNAVLEHYSTGNKADAEFTRGLYYRGVL